MTREINALLRESGFSFIGSVLDRLARYLYLAIITILVAPNEFGTFVFYLSIISLIYSVGNTNTHQALSYFLPILQDSNRTGSGLIRQILKIKLIIGLLLLISSLVFISPVLEFIGADSPPTEVYLLFSLIFIFSLRDIEKEIFRSFEVFRYHVYVNSIFYPIGRLTITVILITTFLPPLESLILGTLIGWLMAVVLGGYFLLRTPNLSFKNEQSGIKNTEIFRYSIPLMGSKSLSSIISQIDIILLGVFLNAESVAFYKIAQTVAFLTKFFTNSLKSISKPLYASLSFEGEDRELSKLYITTARWGTLLSTPVVVYFILFHQQFIELFFDNQYYRPNLVVPILVVGYLFGSMWGQLGQLIEAINRTKWSLYRSITTLSVNFIIDILLIPDFGITGAAIGASVGIVAGTSLELYLVSGELGRLPFTGSHMKYLTSGVLTGVVVHIGMIFFQGAVDSAIIIIFISPLTIVLIYLIIIILANGFNEEDVTASRKISDKIESSTGWRPEFMETIVHLGSNNDNLK